MRYVITCCICVLSIILYIFTPLQEELEDEKHLSTILDIQHARRYNSEAFYRRARYPFTHDKEQLDELWRDFHRRISSDPTASRGRNETAQSIQRSNQGRKQ